MTIYHDELKLKNPAKYKDMMLVGNNSGVMLRNMVKALSILPWFNTDEENSRLAAAKRLIANKY
jgi:hypothetical protein